MKPEPIFSDEEIAARVVTELAKRAMTEKLYPPEHAKHLKPWQFQKGRSGNAGGIPKGGGKANHHPSPKARYTRISRRIKYALTVEKVGNAIAQAIVNTAQDPDHPAWLGAVDRVLERTEGKVMAKATLETTVRIAPMQMVGLTPEELARVAVDFAAAPAELTNGHGDG